MVEPSQKIISVRVKAGGGDIFQFPGLPRRRR